MYGHLDASCDSWSRFLDDYEHISSARADDHFETMRTQFRRHANAQSVRGIAGRTQEIAALKS
ncbi:hypothetical protein ACFWN1_23580 [Streptomyces sp. NPDC058459]|uniref:hypothetical protein n=1 Tax=Streptomyces sp. NPDC058459 TaxID=3346508 RepID=UPI00365A12EB